MHTLNPLNQHVTVYPTANSLSVWLAARNELAPTPGTQASTGGAL